MNTRLIIALILSIALMLLYQLFFIKPPQRSPLPPPPVAASKGELKAETKHSPKAEAYQDIVVDTPLYSATFTTYGGRLKSWRLKRYMDKVPLHPMGRFVQGVVARIMGKKGSEEEIPQPIELVRGIDLIDLPLSLSFPTGGVGYDEVIPFIPSTKGVRLEKEGEVGVLTLRWGSPGGLVVEKKYTFYADSYRVEMHLAVFPPKGLTLKDTMIGLGWSSAIPEEDSRYAFFGPVYYKDGRVRKEKARKVKDGAVVEGIEWFGMEQGYFITLIHPAPKGTTLSLGRARGRVHVTQLSPLEQRPNRWFATSYTLYMGPKIARLLSEVTPTAKGAARFGIWHTLAVPIVWFLNFTHGFTSNYGVDIIILAIILKVLFTPLTLKSQHQMRVMQQLQPEVRRIQQKYKADREALNREIMELYKRRKVNPLGGCLPLLLQMPVFFALYQAFIGAIELRHAPFLLWIRDLSDKDPTYITPLLMGVTMYVQQKMSAVSADPAQMKMMTIMLPIVFTFIFLSLPSGLVIYWLVTNLLAIGHQYLISQKK